MKKLFFFVVVLAIASFTMQAQTVRYVDNNTGAPTAAGLNYTSLQAAINDSSPGDIIYIQPSPNTYGSADVTRTVHIYGLSPNPELNAGQFALVDDLRFNGTAPNSTIQGLYLRDIYLQYGNGNNDGIFINNNRIYQGIHGNNNTLFSADVVISGNYFAADSYFAIDGYNSQNWIINNNIFERTGTNSSTGYRMFYRLNNTMLLNNNIILSRQNGDGSQQICVFQGCNGTQISNNIFIFTGNSVIDFTTSGSNSSLLFNNNLTYSVITNLNPLGGSNIDDTDPLFTSFSPSNSLNNVNNDFTFQGGSPAIGAGSDTKDLGVMNGDFPFNIRMYPTSLPYLKDFVIYNNILSAGTDLNINIKADANNN